jgi:hypothetical protein
MKPSKNIRLAGGFSALLGIVLKLVLYDSRNIGGYYRNFNSYKEIIRSKGKKLAD